MQTKRGQQSGVVTNGTVYYALIVDYDTTSTIWGKSELHVLHVI